MKTETAKRDPAMERAYFLAQEAQNLTALMSYVAMFTTSDALYTTTGALAYARQDA